MMPNAMTPLQARALAHLSLVSCATTAEVASALAVNTGSAHRVLTALEERLGRAESRRGWYLLDGWRYRTIRQWKPHDSGQFRDIEGVEWEAAVR